MKPNPSIPDAVWDKLLSLPSQSLPKRQARPVKRLTSLAHELAADGLLPDAGKLAHAEMHKVLDAARARYKDETANARKSVLEVEGRSLRADLEAGSMSFDDFVEEADNAVIDDAYKRAGRAISPDIERTYTDFLAKSECDETDLEGALTEARVTVAALGLVPEVKIALEDEAEKLAKAWLSKYRVGRKSLSDDRQEAYRQIEAMSVNPVDVDLAKPTSWMQRTTVREADGSETPIPTFERHLLSSDDGRFPEVFNSWETKVLEAELKRSGTVGWYRNPSRASQDSLGVTYESDGEVKILRPDFIFFGTMSDGSVAADIVDPHGLQFGDALPKLKGLATYAEAHPGVYRRIEVFAEVGGKARVIDLTESAARAAVMAAATAKEVYEGEAANDYVL